MRTGDAVWRLIGASLLLGSISACSQLAITATPQADFQDVSLSLSTVNPDEYLHHFEYDRDQPLDIREIQSWRRLNVTVTELTFASPRGEAVPTLLFEPDGAGPFAGLVLMHGAPGQKENFKDLGVHYARYGFVAIAIDAPQFRSEHNLGHVSMALIWPRFEELDLEEQSQLIVDLQRAVDLLLTREKVDPQRLGYIGGSYGGAMGGLFAGVETRLRAYVLKVGDGGIIEHLSEPNERGYPVHLDRWTNILWPIEPLHYVGRAAPAELLFQSGVDDTYVPVSDALRYQQAGSDPKTVIWYNEGHFLPVRHYYDHLMWQHDSIGVRSILLKPLFSASGLIYDRLLLAWFALSAVSMFAAIWISAKRLRSPWSAILAWSLAGLMLGPAGLLALWLLARMRESRAAELPRQTLSASVWLVTVTMLGFAVLTQIGFVTVLHWRFKLLLYYLVPQLIACVALLLRRGSNLGELEGKPSWLAFVLGYISAATFVTICASLLVSLLGRAGLHFLFPIYHPFQWLVLVLAGVGIVVIAYPLHLMLHRWGVPHWTMPGEPPAPSAVAQRRFRWHGAVGMLLASYAALFLLQSVFVAINTPIYVTFFDAVKMMVGLAPS